MTDDGRGVSSSAGVERWDGLSFGTDRSLTPVVITLAYAVFGFVLLFFSDVVLVVLLSDPLLTQVQAGKGAIEVVLTAGFIYLLTSQRETQLGRMRAQLEHERRELALLHRVVRHNLRNDLSVIRAHADMLMASVTGEDEGKGTGDGEEGTAKAAADSGEEETGETTADEAETSDAGTLLDEREIAENCEQIQRVVERMERYTDQAKRIRQAGRPNEPTRAFGLAETVRSVLDRNNQVDDADVSTELHPVTVQANYMLPEALSELVTNAVVHNDDPSVQVEVDPDAGGEGWVVVRVRDDGSGIPPLECEPLKREGNDQLVHLSGLGLWFVEWTVDLSDGDVTFESDDSGTVVRIRLPVADEEEEGSSNDSA